MAVGEESNVVVITYPDDSVAQGAIATLERLSIEDLIDLEDTAYAVMGRNGSLTFHATQAAAGGGAVRGLLTRLPLVGSRPSTSSAALVPRYEELGIDDAFVAHLSERLAPGETALFLLVRSSARDRVIAEMSKFRGTIIKTSFQPEQEQQLKHRLTGQDSSLSDQDP
jgi:uncharacterized membrane protein